MVDPKATTTRATPTQTNRCRHRRTTIRTRTTITHSAYTATGVARAPPASAVRVSAGERTDSKACSTRLSATSNRLTLPVAHTTTQARTTAPESASHHLPEAFRCLGSGGGSPEGRRRLWTRRRAGGCGRATVPVAVTADGSVAMPANGPPEGGATDTPSTPNLASSRPRGEAPCAHAALPAPCS